MKACDSRLTGDLRWSKAAELTHGRLCGATQSRQLPVARVQGLASETRHSPFAQ